MRWIDPTHVASSSTRRARLVLPFALDERGTSGTAVVLGYLKIAEAHGARYVDELAYVIPLRRGDVPIECVSRIVLGSRRAHIADRVATAAAGTHAGASTSPSAVATFEPARVHATVTDRELACERQGTVVRELGPRYGSLYDAENPRRFVTPSGDAVMPITGADLQWQDICELREVRRAVERYDHFVATRFAPPDLDRISRTLAAEPLVELPPVCRTVRVEPGAPLRPRVEANVYIHSTVARGSSSARPPHR